MLRNPALALLTYVTAILRERVDELRRHPDQGSHAVEYAMGIGLGAAVILLLFAAYKSSVKDVILNWVLQ